MFARIMKEKCVCTSRKVYTVGIQEEKGEALAQKAFGRSCV